MKNIFRLMISFVFVVSVDGVSRDQQNNILTCTIQGVVTDIRGAPLAYANVYLERSMDLSCWRCSMRSLM